MLMTVIQMVRKRKATTFRLDTEILEALKDIAQENNTSINNMVENNLFNFCRSQGYLKDIKPLGETRGGNRLIEDNE